MLAHRNHRSTIRQLSFYSESMMIKRKNNTFNKAVKLGLALSQTRKFAAAEKMMTKVGLPYSLIERVLYEPHNVRGRDIDS